MKSLLIVTITLYGTMALACPNLAGTYSCQDDDGESYITTVTQEQNGTETIYNVDGEDYVADGVTRDFIREGDGFMVKGTRNLSCEGLRLRAHEVANFYLGGELLGNYNVLMDIDLNAATNLRVHTRGTQKIGDTKEVINDVDVCERL